MCLILVQCFPLFDWRFKPLDQNQTPVIRQNSGIISSDELVLSSPLCILTTVFSRVHAPATSPTLHVLQLLSLTLHVLLTAFSCPPHSTAMFLSPGSPHTPAAGPIESNLLAQESDGIISDSNPSLKAGAKKELGVKTKILHPHLNGERLFTFWCQPLWTSL